MKIKGVFAAIVLISAGISQQADAQEATLVLPTRISGQWVNNTWSNSWAITKFDAVAKTALATLGPGGDSCGFENVPASIKSWDGKTLHLEVSTRACRFPVAFVLERNGDRWEGQIENDVRTVSASGRGL